MADDGDEPPRSIPDSIVKAFLGPIVYGMDLQAALNADNRSGQLPARSHANVERGKPASGR
jgi:gamma-glutamyltranspeptidase/glutathione hydrolase